MASAKKCDRCGILYESSALPKTDYFIHKLTGDPRLPNVPVDLCPTCVKQLNEWMESPELTMVLIHPSADAVVKKHYIQGSYTGLNYDYIHGSHTGLNYDQTEETPPIGAPFHD